MGSVADPRAITLDGGLGEFGQSVRQVRFDHCEGHALHNIEATRKGLMLVKIHLVK